MRVADHDQPQPLPANGFSAAILFENTMDREVEGQLDRRLSVEREEVVPILKVDKGLAGEKDGVQLMKPMPDLDALLKKAKVERHLRHQDAFGHQASQRAGIKAIVDQQFEVAKQIIAAGLVPIIEPEVDIHCPEKAKAEELLKAANPREPEPTCPGSIGDAETHPAGTREFLQ